MNAFALFCLFLITTVSGYSEMPTMNFRKHFRALSKVRHPLSEDGKPWRDGRTYVKTMMEYYGLGPHLEEQVFNATIGGQTFQGVNLIGIEEGADPSGPFIIVGADYATARLVSPLKDNTGGVACLLETIHIYHDRVDWNPYFKNFSVIFVAFDLNTKEYEGTGMSPPGSSVFVKEWLLPYLNKTIRHRELLGAIIFDSVTTFNSMNDTQRLPEGFDEILPEAYANITENGMKGDFIGLLYKPSETENRIRKTFSEKYNMDRKMRPFRLQEMELHPTWHNIDQVIGMINHQAHYHFWNENLPAFLLFDTDDYRTNPVPDACTAVGCNVDEFLTKGRVDFMTKTTQTVVSTLLELQATPYEPTSGATSLASLPLLFLTSLSFLFAMIAKY